MFVDFLQNKRNHIRFQISIQKFFEFAKKSLFDLIEKYTIIDSLNITQKI